MEAAYQEAESHLAERDDVPDVIKSAQLNSMAFLISDLRAQLTDYEHLQSGDIKSLTLHSVLGELPETLVRARIARGWTHKQLAQALGTSPQQVQKDEAGGYAKASLEKLRRIADVLGISLSGRAKLPSPARSLKSKT